MQLYLEVCGLAGFQSHLYCIYIAAYQGAHALFTFHSDSHNSWIFFPG